MLGDIAVLLTALGVGGIVTKLAESWMANRKGRHEKEQNAWQQRDTEARHRRILEEALHQHRTCWHRLDGRAYDDMPPWPHRPGRRNGD